MTKNLKKIATRPFALLRVTIQIADDRRQMADDGSSGTADPNIETRPYTQGDNSNVILNKSVRISITHYKLQIKTALQTKMSGEQFFLFSTCYLILFARSKAVLMSLQKFSSPILS